jgi:hypothetical protein
MNPFTVGDIVIWNECFGKVTEIVNSRIIIVKFKGAPKTLALLSSEVQKITVISFGLSPGSL